MALRLKSEADLAALKTGGAKAGRYGANKRLETEHGKFDSKGEYKRYLILLYLQQAGNITSLERQVVYMLAPAVRHKDERGRPPLRYVADFRYRDIDNALVVEDFKGNYLTPEFIIKRHLMLSVHGIDLLLTGRKKTIARPIK